MPMGGNYWVRSKSLERGVGGRLHASPQQPQNHLRFPPPLPIIVPRCD